MLTRKSKSISARRALAVCAVLFLGPLTSLTHATEEEIVPELSQAGALIDFAGDVQPILTAKCLKCHGPEEAKNDFRVDEAETLLSYVEPGDVEASSLWSDYLVTDDPDMRMPPASVTAQEQLTGMELATLKLWIEEGGMWNAVSAEPVITEAVESLSMPERIWRFQGLLHPATTHFPIALLTVSAGFVLLSFLRPDTCEPVAFHCLWIGTLGAIVASAAGWSYAVHEGYGASATFDLQNSAIDRHRWLGIAVAVLGAIMIPVAMYVRRTEDFGMRFMWLVGSLLLLGAVGMVGFQGGELTYGEGHYEQEFVKYFPEAFATPDVADAESEEANDVEASEDDAAETKSDEAEVTKVEELSESPVEDSTVVELPAESTDAIPSDQPPSDDLKSETAESDSDSTTEDSEEPANPSVKL